MGLIRTSHRAYDSHKITLKLTVAKAQDHELVSPALLQSITDLMKTLQKTDDDLQHADSHYRSTGELVDDSEAAVATMKQLLEDVKKVDRKIQNCMSDA